MRSDASCSILFYLSASEKFAETLGFYNSVVGKPKLLILTGQLRVSIGLKGVLNNGCADFVPDVNGIEQPGNSSRCLIKFQQTTESTKNGVDIATGNRILCGSGEKLRFCRSVKRFDASHASKTRICNALRLLIIPILFRKFAFDNIIKLYQQRNLPFPVGAVSFNSSPLRTTWVSSCSGSITLAK